MSTLTAFLRRSGEHWLLGMMLLLLHVSLWSDLGSALSRSLMLAHLGLFLIWQPIWHAGRNIDPRTASSFVLFTLGFVVWMNWWLVFLWLLLLIGIMGGRVFIHRVERVAYLVTLIFLIGELLMGCVPHLFDVVLDPNLTDMVYYGLPLLPVVILILPASEALNSEVRPVDFLHGLTAASLSAILALGSLVVMVLGRTSYTTALIQAMLFVSLFLFAISWLLTPHPGFSGLGQLWSRYLLNVSTPFEEWLGTLYRIAQAHDTPEDFLEEAIRQLHELRWVEGVQWESAGRSGLVGRKTAKATTIENPDLRVTLFTSAAPGTTLVLHGKLLIQVVAHFVAAKRAQQTLARQAHLQAIYETGARLTHDIKNLLQSLYTITSAVEQTDDVRDAALQGLLRRQLPLITARLRLSLEKLQSPTECTPESATQAMGLWWNRLVERFTQQGVVFNRTGAGDPTVPVECLDSVVENLLENALQKRHVEPDLLITLHLDVAGNRFHLRVTDTGGAIPPETAGILFQKPVPSSNGLGVGLYQAASLAQRLGYRLSLARNEAGAVCFDLSGTGNDPAHHGP